MYIIVRFRFNDVAVKTKESKSKAMFFLKVSFVLLYCSCDCFGLINVKTEMPTQIN